jgi:hypothetical protein
MNGDATSQQDTTAYVRRIGTAAREPQKEIFAERGPHRLVAHALPTAHVRIMGSYREQIQKIATDLRREADETESTCIRNYGSVASYNQGGISHKRRLADALMTVDAECFHTGVSLRITRVNK